MSKNNFSKNFSATLLRWHKKNERELPWKKTNDAYTIWLSEIILQQTRIVQGTPYYLRFVKSFPTVHHLAKAKEDDVMKLWQGLGYYSRARNLHATAKIISKDFEGEFPASFVELKKLKGIGEYTAAAISSFAFNLPHAVVDGNVFRALARIFGIEKDILSNEAKKYFTELANELLDKKNPAAFNQAMMDFGAMVCKPQNPLCENCPFAKNCFALQKNKVNELPVKAAAEKLKKRYFNFIIIKTERGFLIEKREGNDIWKGLYQFPLIETKKKISIGELMKQDEWKKLFSKNNLPDGSQVSVKQTSNWETQLLSHQKLFVRFVEVKDLSRKLKVGSQQQKFLTKTTFKKFSFPKIIVDFLKKSLLSI